MLRCCCQAPDLVCSPQNPKHIYSIRGLQPFTGYAASVACSQAFGVWSDWSAGVSVTTLDRGTDGTWVTSETRVSRGSAPALLCSSSLQGPAAVLPAGQHGLRWASARHLAGTAANGETSSSGTRFTLFILPQALDPRDAGGRVLGYQVSYGRVREGRQRDRRVVNVTEEASALEVGEGTWSVSVAAFNTAGVGPAASLSLDTRRHQRELNVCYGPFVTGPEPGSVWVKGLDSNG